MRHPQLLAMQKFSERLACSHKYTKTLAENHHKSLPNMKEPYMPPTKVSATGILRIPQD